MKSSLFADSGIRRSKKYEENKVLYYSLAKNSPSYDKTTKLQESLETEINIKRFLGIFIAAEDDAELSNFVVDTFIKKYPEKRYNIIIPENLTET